MSGPAPGRDAERLLALQEDASHLSDYAAFADAVWQGVFLERDQGERVRRGFASLLSIIKDTAEDIEDRIREARGEPPPGD